jgi:hypothetical protein
MEVRENVVETGSVIPSWGVQEGQR